MVVLSDKRVWKTDRWDAEVITAQDYDPFGMVQPGRSWKRKDSFRFGFNGKENEEWGVQDYGFRMYDWLIGRFISVDPLAKHYPYKTPYDFAENQPIWVIDLDGLEKLVIVMESHKNEFNGNVNPLKQQGFDVSYVKNGKAIIDKIREYGLKKQISQLVLLSHGFTGGLLAMDTHEIGGNPSNDVETGVYTNANYLKLLESNIPSQDGTGSMEIEEIHEDLQAAGTVSTSDFGKLTGDQNTSIDGDQSLFTKDCQVVVGGCNTSQVANELSGFLQLRTIGSGGTTADRGIVGTLRYIDGGNCDNRSTWFMYDPIPDVKGSAKESCLGGQALDLSKKLDVVRSPKIN